MKKSKKSGPIFNFSSIRDKTSDTILLKRLQENRRKEYEKIICLTDVLKRSLSGSFSILISGSNVFSSRANSFEDESAQSDLDLWVIISDNTESSNATSVMNGVLEQLKQNDMVQYLVKEDAILSIKFLYQKTANELLSFTKTSILVRRVQSLFIKKTFNKFYGFDRVQKIPVKETQIDEAYIWEWEMLFNKEKESFIMSDLMSFIIFGIFVEDQLNIKKVTDAFIKKIDRNIGDFTYREAKNVFLYFKQKQPIAYKQFTIKLI